MLTQEAPPYEHVYVQPRPLICADFFNITLWYRNASQLTRMITTQSINPKPPQLFLNSPFTKVLTGYANRNIEIYSESNIFTSIQLFV